MIPKFEDLYYPIHSNILLEGLNNLREQGVLIDVTLRVGNNEHKAHKVVLSACSDYFRAMFNVDMVESQNNIITLHDVSSIGFKMLLNYMYTSQLELNEDNIIDVLEVAHYLQVTHAMDKCLDFLRNHLNRDNCILIAQIAECYTLKSLTTAAYTFICSNLSEISNQETFLNIRPADMENFMSYDLPVDCTEADLLRFILKWFFNGNILYISEKLQRLPNILKQIKYEQIPQSSIDHILEFMYSKYCIREYNIQIYKAVSNYIKSAPSIGLDLSCLRFNSRGMETALIKIGGFGKDGITNVINFCFHNEREWYYLTRIPNAEQCNFAAAVLDNNLYVVGGCFNQILQEIIHPDGFKYDPRLDRWQKIAPMRTDRCRFTLTPCDGNLYAVGGVCEFEHEPEYTSTCECYYPSQDKWEFVDPLPDYKSQHAAASLTVNGVTRLYVSGGIDREHVLDSMHCFDTQTRTWQACTPMLTPRADHCMFSFNKKVYVCGGWHERLIHSHFSGQAKTIDVYDCQTDSWAVLTQIPNPRHHEGIVAHGSKIYVVGGFMLNTIFHKDVAPVECYDILTNTWTFDDKDAQVYWEHSCAVMYVPRNFFVTDRKEYPSVQL